MLRTLRWSSVCCLWNGTTFTVECVCPKCVPGFKQTTRNEFLNRTVFKLRLVNVFECVTASVHFAG